jgi:hypothetical protein
VQAGRAAGDVPQPQRRWMTLEPHPYPLMPPVWVNPSVAATGTVGPCVIPARTLPSTQNAHGLRAGAGIAVPGGLRAERRP